jgi:hypothetical protein
MRPIMRLCVLLFNINGSLTLTILDNTALLLPV